MKKYLLLVLLLVPMLVHAAEVAVSNAPSGVPGVDWQAILAQLSKAVVEVMLPVLIALIAWIGKKLLDMIHISVVRSLVKRLVLSAFQRFTSNTERFDYVAKKINEKYKYLSEEEIKDYIEEAVVGLKSMLNAPKVPSK